MEYQNNNGYEIGWNDEIENEGQEFILAPAGDYDFVVTGFERARHSGSEKIPPCNKAVLTIQVQTAQGPVGIRHQLLLHSKCEWKLCEFFTAIGQRKHGQRAAMNWNAVTGAKGRCKVKVRTYQGKDGSEKRINEIEKFYEPDRDIPFTMPATSTGYIPGKF